MHFLVPILLITAAGGVPLAEEDALLPAAPSSSRYAEMMAESPFVLASPPAEVAPEKKESFAANWYLTGMAKREDAAGAAIDIITIRSRDNRLSFTLRGDAESHDPDAKGVSLASVHRSDKPRKSFVMLRKGAELAKVEFSEEPTASAPMAANQGNTGRPGQMPTAPRIGAPPPMGGVRSAYNPNPGINPIAPNQPAANTILPPNGAMGNPRSLPPGIVVPLGGNGDGAPKRRVRVINSQ